MYAKQISALKARNRSFVAGEIVTFIAFIAFIAAYTSTSLGPALLVFSALSMAAYIVIRRMDTANSERLERLKDLKAVNENETKYLQGNFSPFDDGKRYSNPAHPFALDMDIFGPSSLYHRVCRTVTTGGADRLAASLGRQFGGLDMADGKARQAAIEGINRRREAIEWLSEKCEWREAFLAFGAKQRIDSARINKAIAAVADTTLPRWAASKGALCAAWASLAGFYATAALSTFTSLPSNVSVLWGIVNLSAALMLFHGFLKKAGSVADNLHTPMKAYAELISMVAALRQNDGKSSLPAELDGIVSKLDGALESFHGIERIMKALDRRGNILGLIIFDALSLSDFFLMRKLLSWQGGFVGQVRQWVDAVSQADALTSMATFSHNEPRGHAAELSCADEVVYEATGLCHPFLGEKAVANDFSIKNGNYYIITGANMAGKSTFLRSLGINYVLAMNGMPVFASKMKISVFALFTSMRTTDDLTHGISYFNAELLRLKQLISYCRTRRNTLIILDEILKGTNSVDKLNGSRLFLEYISKQPVTGVVATHDLELSKMADNYPSRFHNYCFEIELGAAVTYSYKITPGIAHNQNATFLLNELLKGSL